jgi:hypothetical protein
LALARRAPLPDVRVGVRVRVRVRVRVTHCDVVRSTLSTVARVRVRVRS